MGVGAWGVGLVGGCMGMGVGAWGGVKQATLVNENMYVQLGGVARSSSVDFTLLPVQIYLPPVLLTAEDTASPE